MKDALGASLGKSLKAEEDAVKSRFDKAEQVFSSLNSTPQEQPQEPKKRVVRDTFTLPTDDYELIAVIKERCLNCGVNVTKSEAIRAGLHALNELTDEKLLNVVKNLTKVKTGRPSKKE
ncbi:MAG: hypothetical protein F6K31_05010 [Symploca sp. SIO2G7]|nr:hypothetical protein [Symploca sp. SIO2G7]